jgi:hypothetical protein
MSYLMYPYSPSAHYGMVLHNIDHHSSDQVGSLLLLLLSEPGRLD